MKVIISDFTTAPTLELIVNQLSRIDEFARDVHGQVSIIKLDIEITVKVPSPEEEEEKAE